MACSFFCVDSHRYTGSVTDITRAVTTKDLEGLLEEAEVALVAWSRDGHIAAEPAAFRFESGMYFIGLPPGTLSEDTEVAALIDDGALYFDLRGVRVRGRISSSSDAQGGGLDWFVIQPEREVAWDYGRLRER